MDKQYKAVPTQPKYEMCEAFEKSYKSNKGMNWRWRIDAGYKAMLAAAPDASKFYDPDGGRESVEDALAVVESFGPGIDGVNDTFARQIILAEEVKRLRNLYEMSVKGRSDFRNALRDSRNTSPAEPPDREAIRNAVINDAVGICEDMEYWDRDTFLERMKSQPAQPSDSRTEFSDTEILDWVTENRAIVDYYGNGYRVCFIDDGSFYPEVYPTIQEAIKAAMRAEKEGL